MFARFEFLSCRISDGKPGFCALAEVQSGEAAGSVAERASAALGLTGRSPSSLTATELQTIVLKQGDGEAPGEGDAAWPSAPKLLLPGIGDDDRGAVNGCARRKGTRRRPSCFSPECAWIPCWWNLTMRFGAARPSSGFERHDPPPCRRKKRGRAVWGP